ncbi:MAG TPA: NAD-dependent epimerase/dehydratase family protein [Niabella sp.]|nr:NAD-dependent epimerase/dehydratase family protein [Niabella sp.]
MKVVITGASGFVGRNLSKYLKEKGNEIEALSLRSDQWTFSEDANALIHLAGKAHDTRNISASEEYFKINTELTQKVFDKFLDSNIRDFIYFSSVKATADTVENILDENNINSPQTPYGKSKLAAEKYILSKNIPAEKRVLIVRPCMIHGPGNKGNLNLLYKILQKGIPWPLAVFENKRSFLSIDNLNFLIYEMLKNKNVSAGVYNFSDDQSLSTNDLIKIIANASGKKASLLYIPKNIILGIAKLGDFFRLPLNSERVKKLTESYVVTNEKIKHAIGIKNLPVSARDGITNTISSFKK